MDRMKEGDEPMLRPRSWEWKFAAYIGFVMGGVLLLLAIFLFLYVLLAELQRQPAPSIAAPLVCLAFALLTIFTGWRAWRAGLETKLEELQQQLREKQERV